jgi:hypothetical protein
MDRGEQVADVHTWVLITGSLHLRYYRPRREGMVWQRVAGINKLLSEPGIGTDKHQSIESGGGG